MRLLWHLAERITILLRQFNALVVNIGLAHPLRLDSLNLVDLQQIRSSTSIPNCDAATINIHA